MTCPSRHYFDWYALSYPDEEGDLNDWGFDHYNIQDDDYGIESY